MNLYTFSVVFSLIYLLSLTATAPTGKHPNPTESGVPESNEKAVETTTKIQERNATEEQPGDTKDNEAHSEDSMQNSASKNQQTTTTKASTTTQKSVIGDENENNNAEPNVSQTGAESTNSSGDVPVSTTAAAADPTEKKGQESGKQTTPLKLPPKEEQGDTPPTKPSTTVKSPVPPSPSPASGKTSMEKTPTIVKTTPQPDTPPPAIKPTTKEQQVGLHNTTAAPGTTTIKPAEAKDNKEDNGSKSVPDKITTTTPKPKPSQQDGGNPDKIMSTTPKPEPPQQDGGNPDKIMSTTPKPEPPQQDGRDPEGSEERKENDGKNNEFDFKDGKQSLKEEKIPPRNKGVDYTYGEGESSPGAGHFMAYFLTAVVLCVAGYVIFHNKQKIVAFIVEGRNGRRGTRRPNKSGYKKLSPSGDDVLPKLEKSTSSSQYIY